MTRAVFRLTALVAALLLGAAPAAADLAPATAAHTGTLPGGASYVLRGDPAAGTAAIELWFRAPSAGYDLGSPGIARLALSAIAASSAPHGTSLAEMIRDAGGTLALNVYPDIVSVAASVPAADAQRTIAAVTNAYFNPEISDDGLKDALRDCAIAAAETQFDAQSALHDALFAHLFASGPAHIAPVPDSSTDFTAIPTAHVSQFARQAFREGNAILVLTGAVTQDDLARVHSGTKGAGMDSPFDSATVADPADVTLSAAVSGFGMAWAGPPISDEKASTAMDFIADYLFDAQHGTLARAAREKGGSLFVGGQFITLHDPGVLLVTVSGDDAASLRKQISNAVAAMSAPMSAAAFADARAGFEYDIVSQIQTPMTRADSLGWYTAEGSFSYAPGGEASSYFSLAQSLDPAYVASIAQKYLRHPAIVELSAQHEQGAPS